MGVYSIWCIGFGAVSESIKIMVEKEVKGAMMANLPFRRLRKLTKFQPLLEILSWVPRELGRSLEMGRC